MALVLKERENFLIVLIMLVLSFLSGSIVGLIF